MKETGLTKDAGYQIGVRKTFAVPLQDVWNFMFCNDGIAIWLGELESGTISPSCGTFSTKDGITGNVTLLKHLSHIRLKYKVKGWENTSILQVQIIAVKNSTTISFHQDHLTSAQQREQMKAHWDAVFKKIKTALAGKMIINYLCYIELLVACC
jgi:uncharacterized protein YndB with AHSA1/START domain